MLTRALPDRPLAEVVAALRSDRRATAAMLIGSARDEALAPSSDIDLVVVVAGMRVQLSSALVRIDGRVGDVVFVADERVRKWLAEATPPPRTYWRQGLSQWVHDGRILFEHDGILSRIRELTAAAHGPVPAGFSDAYAAWYSGFYSLHQLERLLDDDQPAVRLHVELRLGHIVHQAAQFYFMVRGLPWSGSRHGLAWMAENDAPTFALLRRSRDERDARRAWALSRELMERVMAPVGPWPEGHAAVGFERGLPPDAEAVREGLDLLEALLGAG